MGAKRRGAEGDSENFLDISSNDEYSASLLSVNFERITVWRVSYIPGNVKLL